MTKNENAQCITVALATLALVLNGCFSPMTDAEIAARDARNDSSVRSGAEQIPQHLAADAAAAFAKGKAFYIWSDGGSTIYCPPQEPIKLHYAVNPQVQPLPCPGTAVAGGPPEGGGAMTLTSLREDHLPFERLAVEGTVYTFFWHEPDIPRINRGHVFEQMEQIATSNILTNQVLRK